MPAPPAPDPPWPDVERLFLAALDLDPAARTAALAAEPDAAVRDAAASLLASLDAAGGFLDRLDPGPLSALIRDTLGDEAERAGEDAAPDVCAGARVGAWRLVREAGRGGMGVVWLAERADGAFAQRVALKLLPPGPDGSLGRRLVRERQALARMEHPAIARLLDGGEAAGGRPFYAMEFVDGVPITEWADARRLDVAARVALFAEAVDAVRHAHRHLVVHRDLKPSNVFVAEDEDGRPAVKLLDFGLARLLDPDADDDEDARDDTGDGARAGAAEALTRAGVRPMTPEYAAPEQVRGEPVTTATDVYALGVVLYELLAGRRPYAFPDRRSATITRVVETAVPEPPSRAVRHPAPDGTPPEAVALARGATPGHLARTLRGGLDAVVGRALAKDPAVRYPSAGALAADLARWTAGRPVAAGLGRGRVADARYTAARFARRNRPAVAAAAVLALAVAVGVVGTLVQTRAARAEAARANASRDFVLGVFAGADPAADAAAVTARDLLDAAATDVHRDLASQPEMQAEMERTLGDLYGRLSLYEPAVAQYDAAVRTEMRLHGAAHAHTATALDLLASALTDTGDLGRAETTARQAVAAATAADGPGSVRAATATATLASVLDLTGDPDAADRLLGPALAVLRRAADDPDADLAGVLSLAATVRRSRGDLAGAERLAREALAMARARHGSDHVDTVTLLNNLGIILRERSRLAEAERAFRHVLAFDVRRLAPDHIYLATARSNLASVEMARGFEAAAGPDPAAAQPFFARGERLYRQVLATDRARLGDRHPYTALAMMQLAGTLREQGRLAEAERLARGAAERTPDPADPVYPWMVLERGRIALAAGDLDAAGRFIPAACAALDSAIARDDVRRSTAIVALARLRRAQGRGPEATRLFEQAVAVAVAGGGPAHFRTRTALRARDDDRHAARP